MPGFPIVFGGRWGSASLCRCAVTGSTVGCRGCMRDLRSCEVNPGFTLLIAPLRARSCPGLASPSSAHGEGACTDPDPRQDHASKADVLLAAGGLARGAAALPASGQSRRAAAKGLHRVNCLKPNVFILENAQGSAFPTRNPGRGREPGWVRQNPLPLPLEVRIRVAQILRAQGWG